MNSTNYILIILISILLSTLMKVHVLDLEIQGKHTWRQSQTALNIRNFARHDANILNPRLAHFNSDDCNIKRKEFPLMQWSIAMVHRIFGERILYTRLCILLISFFSILALFKTCALLFKSKVWASLAIWVICFCPVFFYQSISPLPDNLALCFGIFFLYYFFRYLDERNATDLYASALFLGLSSLCKLPFIIYGIIPAVYITSSFLKGHRYKEILNVYLIFFLFQIPSIAWYLYVIPEWNSTSLTDGIFDNSVGLDKYFYYLSIQLLETIPSMVINYPTAVLIVIGAILALRNNEIIKPKVLFLFSGLLLCIVYFFFILKQIQGYHDYYHLPFIPFYIILSVYAIKKISAWNKLAYIFMAVYLLLMPLFCWSKTKTYWNADLSYTNLDLIKYRHELQDAVPTSESCIMINDKSFSIMPYAIDKQGYIFYNDHLPLEWIEDLIKRNKANYLYSDSRTVEEQHGFENYIQDTIGIYGSINVFKLKTSKEIIAN